jgi:hypothetical protein
MNERLQHDPKTKQQIKDLLYSFLYDPINKKMKEQVDSIIVKNSAMIQSSHLSFHYKGKLFSCDSGFVLRKPNRLTPLLHPFMDDHLKEVKELNEREIPYVIGFINQVLNSSNNIRDYLRVLPTSIHRPIELLMATCPCVTYNISVETVKDIQDRNAESIIIMKSRMAINLIL